MPVTFPKILRRSLLWLIILLGLWAVGRLVQVSYTSLYGGERGPYLQNVGETAVTIRWETINSEIGVLRYGSDPEMLHREVRSTGDEEDHELRVTGLIPATRYYYSIGTPEAVWQGGDDYWFVTPPAAGTETPVRFWVIGDQGLPGPHQDAVTHAARNWLEEHRRPGRPLLDLWLTTGDNAYRSGSNPQFQAALFEPYADLLRNVPIWPVYGNHDARRWAFFNIFTFPEDGEAGGVPSGTEEYFAFEFAQVHFVILNSSTGDLDQGSDMLNWLQADLAATAQHWIIVLLHHPPYSKGTHNSDDRGDSDGRIIKVRENVVPLLEDAGVDLLLAGHSHMYERSYLLDGHYGMSDTLTDDMILDRGNGDPRGSGPYRKATWPRAPREGIVYIVVGSSSKLDEGPLDHPVMVAPRKEMGSLIVDIDGARLDAVFINEAGEESDRFAIVKGVTEGPQGSGGLTVIKERTGN